MELRTASFGRCIDVPPAEDDDEPNFRPTTEADKPDDAVDDADYVRGIHMAVPCWFGCLHSVLKHRRCSDSVLRRRQTTNRTIRTVVPGYRCEQG